MQKEKSRNDKKKMNYKKVKNSSKNEDLYEIESVDSPSKSSTRSNQVFSYDRPGISALNQPRNVLQTSKNAKSPVSTSKADFIKNWLKKAEIERNESFSSTLSPSIFDNSPPSVKRLPLSPLRPSNDLKRRKSSIEAKISPKKGEIQKENYEKNGLSPTSRMMACRIAIFGTNHQKKNKKIEKNPCELIEENGSDVLKQLIAAEEPVISQCPSVASKNLEIESASSTQSEEVPPIIDDNSINSSQKIQDIDSHFTDDDEGPMVIDNVGDDEELGIIDNKKNSKKQVAIDIEDDNESNSKETIDQLIEDPEGDLPVQNHLDQRVERISSEDFSQDLDKTYFSEGSPVNRGIEECASQKISDITLTPQDTNLRRISTFSDNDISVEASPPQRKIDGETYPSINQKTGKNKKKCKKGTMLERLQNLSVKKISFLRIWHHQMAQSSFRGTVQYVMMKISKFSMIYGRPVFEGIVIKDNSDLLDKSVNNSSDSSADMSNNLLNRNITVLTIPEIVGQVSVKDKNALKFYPPWEIIDVDKLILSVLKFHIISDDSENSQIVKESMDKNVVIKEFNCCCLKNGRITKSCCEKFSNSKPTAIDFIFK